MGERSHIIVQSVGVPSVVLYGHWAGERNLATVKAAFEDPEVRTKGDPTYLTASLFHFFSTHPDSGYDGHMSYGIWAAEDVSPASLDANHDPVYVNADTGEYRVNDPYTF